jgi:glucokinase
MDVVGTWIRASLVDQQGNTLWGITASANQRTPENAESVEIRVGRVARNALQRAEWHVIVGLGLAVAGPLDPATGVMFGPPNLPELDGVSLKSNLQDSFDISVTAGNNANLATMAGFTYGAGGQAPVLVYLTISTGIGRRNHH